MTIEIISENRSHGGRQLVVKHSSRATSTDMTFSIFLPPQAEDGGKAKLFSQLRDAPGNRRVGTP